MSGEEISENEAFRLMLQTAGKTFVVAATALAVALSIAVPQHEHSIEAREEPSKLASS